MDIDVLRTRRVLVTHNACPSGDGLASALIIKDALPEIEVRFMDYDTPEHRAFEPQEGIIFCDFTPWVEREKSEPHAMTARGREIAGAWCDVGAVVLDHHAGAADLVEVFGDRGVYADAPGVSGALLAYVEVWRALHLVGCVESDCQPEEVRRFAEVVGVRDMWRTKHPDWRAACAQAAALGFWPRSTLLRDGLAKVIRGRLSLGVGEVILEQQAVADRRTIAEAHCFEAAHDEQRLRVMCFEGGSREASDIAEAIGTDADMVVAWHYFVQGGVPKLKLSCRSCGEFQCLAFAQHLGGNGHPHAAGVAVELTTYKWHFDPYTLLEMLADRFLEQR